MAISETKMQIVIDNYFKSECDVNTSIRQAFEKGFRIGVMKGQCSQENKEKWIPVSERLPEKFSFVDCTCHSLIDDREDWVVETVYVPQPLNSPYSDWGNIPMLNDKECEVIAWMYRDIPEPYKVKRGEE